MSVVAFGDVQKSANDLLKDNFALERKFKLTTKASNGITLTTEGALTDKGSDNKLGAKFKVDFLSVDKLQVTSAGRFALEASVKDIVPNLKVGAKYEDGVAGSGDIKGSINATFNQPLFTVAAEVDLINGPTLTESATFSHSGFVVGAEVKYNTQLDEKEPKPAITGLSAILGYSQSDLSVSLKAADKGKKVSLAAHQVVDTATTLAVLLDIEPAGTSKLLTVGATHKLDENTTFAGKLDSKGVLTASFSQVLRPSAKLLTTAQVDTKNFAGDSHKFGLQLILG